MKNVSLSASTMKKTSLLATILMSMAVGCAPQDEAMPEDYLFGDEQTEGHGEEAAPLELVGSVTTPHGERIDFLRSPDPEAGDVISVGVIRPAGQPSQVRDLLDAEATPLELYLAFAGKGAEAHPALLRDQERRAAAGMADYEPATLDTGHTVPKASSEAGMYACHIWRSDVEIYADDHNMAYSIMEGINQTGSGYLGTQDNIYAGACNYDISDTAVRVRIQTRPNGGNWSTLPGYTYDLPPGWAYDFYNLIWCNSSTHHRIYVDQVMADGSEVTGDWYDLAGAWAEACLIIGG